MSFFNIFFKKEQIKEIELSEVTCFDTLPIEINLEIIEMLKVKELINLQLTSRGIRQIFISVNFDALLRKVGQLVRSMKKISKERTCDTEMVLAEKKGREYRYALGSYPTCRMEMISPKQMIQLEPLQFRLSFLSKKVANKEKTFWKEDKVIKIQCIEDTLLANERKILRYALEFINQELTSENQSWMYFHSFRSSDETRNKNMEYRRF